MKRVALIAVALFAVTLKADIMLWQVTTANLPDGLDSGIYKSIVEARLMSGETVGSGTILQYAGIEPVASGPIMEVQNYDLTVLPPGLPQMFYIELYSYDQSGNAILQAYSSVVSAKDLQDFIISDSLMNVKANAWSGGKFRATPEPTSGLLVLFGLAGLALRRRKA